MQPLDLPGRRRRIRRSQQVADPVVVADLVEHHRPRTETEPGREHLPVVGQDLSRDAVPAQRLQQRARRPDARSPGPTSFAQTTNREWSSIPVTTFSSRPSNRWTGPSRPSATTPSTGSVPTAGSPPAAADASSRPPARDGPAPDRPTTGPATGRRRHGQAASGSGPDPTPDAPDASPPSALRPAPASDADTTPAATTDRPARQTTLAAYRRNHSCTVCRVTPKRRATSITDAPSSTSAPPDTAAPRRPAPPARPAPFPTITRSRGRTDNQRRERETPDSVAHLPEQLSPTYRNRVHNLSPRNRNPGVKHEPEKRGTSGADVCGHILPT